MHFLTITDRLSFAYIDVINITNSGFKIICYQLKSKIITLSIDPAGNG